MYIGFKYLIYSLLLLISSGLDTFAINVKDFGAKGDGKTDDTNAINRASDAAFKKKEALVFQSGTYLVRYLDIKSDLEGVRGKTTIRKINVIEDNIYKFCNINDRSLLSIKNIIFDGSVNGSDIKPESGSIPLFIYNGKDIRIYNCVFVNSPASGIRVEASKSVEINQCLIENTNGIFGDGIYVESSHDIKIYNVKVKDYTRIAFVIEKNTRNVNFENCLAANGHDASILYGGTEFNAGFWVESSANVSINRCVAQNNTHYGFVMTSGIEPEFLAPEKIVEFLISNSQSLNNPIGFRVSSSGNQVDVLVDNCKALDSNQGFIAFARDKKDKFKFKDCLVTLLKPSKSSVNDAGYMWESEIGSDNDFPIFIYENCTTNFIGHIPFDKLFNRNTNYADLSTYSGGNARIFINRMKNNTISKRPVIKAIKGNPQFEIKNTNPDIRFLIKNENVIINE